MSTAPLPRSVHEPQQPEQPEQKVPPAAQDPIPAPGTAPPPDGPEPRPRRHRALMPRRVGGPRRWWDWVLAADPGLADLQSAWRTLISLVAGLAVGYGMAHALNLPAMLGMMIGAMIGQLSANLVAENTLTKLAAGILPMPLPMLAGLTASTWTQPHRTLAVWIVSAALVVVFACLKFGPVALRYGLLLFVSLLMGALMPLTRAQCGRLLVVALVVAVACLAGRIVLCYPTPYEDLLRTQRAFVVEARRVAGSAAEVVAAVGASSDQAAALRRMDRALRRLNTRTLTIDAQLAQPEVAADPHTAELLHQHLFDCELALQGIGGAARRIAGTTMAPALREAVGAGLATARDIPLNRTGALRPAADRIRTEADAAFPSADGSPSYEQLLARRIATLLDELADSLTAWLSLGRASSHDRTKASFRPTVILEAGALPGSGPSARRVLAGYNGPGWRRAVPFVRAPLQAAAAVAITVPLADAVNPARFYWGLVGIMITLLGNNTLSERLRKLVHRIAGTVVGAVIGVALVHLIGPGHIYWTLTVIVVAITLGTWGMKRQYGYWAVGLVTALVQMYALSTPTGQLDHLLTERVEDNGLGILVATLCASAIFPAPTRRVARESARVYLTAVTDLVHQVGERWADPETPIRLRGAALGVSNAMHQLQAVHRPVLRLPVGRRGRAADNLLGLASTATGHAKALATAADIDIDLSPPLRTRVRAVVDTMAGSLAALDRTVAGNGDGAVWVRVDPLLRELRSELHLATGPRADALLRSLRELAALDETMAGLAATYGMEVTEAPRADWDTARPQAAG
ncbi:FUSC family protein [Actinacidiphila sp. bgisy144]|uniref:FUSC family protein n=1 Tax=Actinacidiphila sp. bgisy144 TaxID=3413791 RepID=UPI003EBE1BE5